jgi:AcrR family transcriptional regulator
MPVKSRREEYAEVTRGAIVEAAVARFAADGYAGANIDSIAELARVTKGAVYHHFADKAELFEAAYVAMEDRLLARVVAGVQGIDDPWRALLAGAGVFLEECCQPDFRRIALEEAPVALGWARWKASEEKYFLGLLSSALNAMAEAGLITIPTNGDLTARVVLAALDEAGLSVGSSADPEAERHQALDLIARMLGGLRTDALD